VSRGLHAVRVKNFGILGDVNLGPLGRVNVLVGPNGSGKSTLLRVIQFLGDAARLQLSAAVEAHGGFDRLRTRASTTGEVAKTISIEIEATVTKHAHGGALDEYSLFLEPFERMPVFSHHEFFKFKRTAGKGRRITLDAGKLHIEDEGRKPRQMGLDSEAFGLAVLPQLGAAEGSTEVKKLQELFTTFRVFDINAPAARRPADVRRQSPLQHDAANLAAFLAYLHDEHADAFTSLVADAREMVTGLTELRLRPVGGAAEAVAVEIVDRGRSGVTPLSDASFGTVRALALLAMLYDPAPPLLTCIEEIDHGLHPHVFDRLVELLRRASDRTQFLVATHSPALVNRLRPEELIVCERDAETGLARIPAIDVDEIRRIKEAGDLGLGELWFSGTLGGVPR
jgi:predicted ATPase